jgi:putative addiction module component (TIGR02574 family)
MSGAAMNKRVQVILEGAMALSVDDRAALAAELLDSLKPMTGLVADDWAAEMKARAEALERGELSSEDATAILSEARDRLKR